MKTLPLKLDSEYQLDAYRDGKFEFSFNFTKTIPEDEQVRLAKEYAEAINNREQLSALQQENEKLRKFKKYVHERLDRMGIPSDPEPENNIKHGCRIEGRLNLVGNMIYPNTVA